MSPDGHIPADQSLPLASKDGELTWGMPQPASPEHAETNPAVIARLEWLDDLMFAAIEGDPAALDTAADAWKKTLDELGADAIEESRRQYLRCAESAWNALRNEPNHSSQKVFAAIEVISLLAGKAW